MGSGQYQQECVSVVQDILQTTVLLNVKVCDVAKM